MKLTDSELLARCCELFDLDEEAGLLDAAEARRSAEKKYHGDFSRA